MPDSDFDFEFGVNLDPCTQQAADAYTKVANVRRRAHCAVSILIGTTKCPMRCGVVRRGASS